MPNSLMRPQVQALVLGRWPACLSGMFGCLVPPRGVARFQMEGGGRAAIAEGVASGEEGSVNDLSPELPYGPGVTGIKVSRYVMPLPRSW